MPITLENRGDETAAYHYGGRYFEILAGEVREFADDVARHLLGHLTAHGVVLAETPPAAADEPGEAGDDEGDPRDPETPPDESPGATPKATASKRPAAPRPKRTPKRGSKSPRKKSLPKAVADDGAQVVDAPDAGA